MQLLKNKYLLNVFLSLVLFFLFISAASWGLLPKIIIGLAGYFYFSEYLINQNNNSFISKLIVLLPVTVPLVYTLFHISTTLHSLPGSLAPFVGFFVPQIGFVHKSKTYLIIMLFALLIGATVSYQLFYENWQQWTYTR